MKFWWLLLVGLVSGLLVLAACAPAAAPPAPTPQPTPTAQAPSGAALAHDGRLYDDWAKEIKATVPTGNQPLWALQTTNTRTGAITWRCKECHGWDYKGKDGAYGKGSHKTGFPGVLSASAQSKDQLLAALKGTKNPSHDFASLLGDLHAGHIVDFLKAGMIDLAPYVDSATKKAVGANAAEGKKLFDSTCVACHGADGRTLKFGEEVVGTIASDNPWEFVHKVRFGQPGAPMPTAVELGWTMQQVVDVLGYAQTLPTK